MTKELRNSIKLVIFAIFTALAISGAYFALTIEEKIANAFENGYQQAILDAELVAIDGNEYIISFNGEEHIYSSTIGKKVMDEASKNGYQQAIYDAELVESNDEGYTLSFNGEVNWYTFD